MSTSLWPRCLALVSALALGLLGSSLGPSGCVVGDTCIVIANNGTDWCTQVDGALMWPVGQPDLAEPVVTSAGLPPSGCVCMNSGEFEILFDQTPADVYVALVEEIEAAARADCASLVPPGYHHNCLQYVDGAEIPAPTFDLPLAGNESRECIGTCSYGGEPLFGPPCGDPDPWECNGEDPPWGEDTGDGDDTGSGEDTGGSEDTGGLVEFGP